MRNLKTSAAVPRVPGQSEETELDGAGLIGRLAPFRIRHVDSIDGLQGRMRGCHLKPHCNLTLVVLCFRFKPGSSVAGCGGLERARWRVLGRDQVIRSS